MIKHKLLLAGAALAGLLSTTQLATAGEFDDNHVVYDIRGNIVHTRLFNNCVRTQWEAGEDACAPTYRQAQVVQQQAPAPAPTYSRTVLGSADKTVYFAFNSAALSAEAKERLGGVAQTLRNAEDVQRLRIIGYADRKGSATYNVKLSKKRAVAVKDYLAQQGYHNTRVEEVRGLGETASVTSCSTSLPRTEEIACLSRDRRVELAIDYVETRETSETQ